MRSNENGDAYLIGRDGREFFIETDAIAEMLKGSDLFIGGEHGPFFVAVNDDQTPVSIWVNCNDLFAWGCADAEPLTYDQIEPYYKAYKAGNWETTKWACRQRNMQPQAPIRNKMKKAGAWDDEMAALPKNPDEKPKQQPHDETHK